jgi:hypothetical protein
MMASSSFFLLSVELQVGKRSIAAATRLPKAPIVALETGGPDMPMLPIMVAPNRNGANQLVDLRDAGSRAMNLVLTGEEDSRGVSIKRFHHVSGDGRG